MLSVVFLGENPSVLTIRENPPLEFDTKKLSAAPDVTAPDGSDVRILLGLQGGGMAHFELQPRPDVQSRYPPHGRRDLVFSRRPRSNVAAAERPRGNRGVEPGVCLTIPLGTHFQFRALGDEPLAAIAVTLPPWPGEDEAYPVEGRWPVTGSD